MASCLGPEGAKQPQTKTLPPPSFTVGRRFFFLKCCLLLPDMTSDIERKHHLSLLWMSTVLQKCCHSCWHLISNFNLAPIFCFESRDVFLADLLCRPNLWGLFLMVHPCTFTQTLARAAYRSLDDTLGVFETSSCILCSVVGVTWSICRLFYKYWSGWFQLTWKYL